VIKPAFVTGGKGVRVITTNLEDAYEAVDELMATRPGKIILVEEFLKGRELSFTVMVDETGGFVCLIPTQDYKELNGRMTGGVGARTVPEMNAALHDKIIDKIVRPTIAKLPSIGVPYKGFLYFGLMIVEENGEEQPYVLELNCRPGDPEAPVILSVMESDFVELCIAFFENRLDRVVIEWEESQYVVVVVVGPGYPARPIIGDVVYNLEKVKELPGVDVFYAGVAFNAAGELITAGGRVVAVGARGKTLDEAYVKAHGAASLVSIGDADPQMGTQVIRPDVGLRVLPKSFGLRPQDRRPQAKEE
jgi:phosphoribosylamine--glycine ligase